MCTPWCGVKRKWAKMYLATIDPKGNKTVHKEYKTSKKTVVE